MTSPRLGPVHIALALAAIAAASLGCAGGPLYAEFCDESDHDESVLFYPGISTRRTFDVTLATPLDEQPCIDNGETWSDEADQDRLVVRCGPEWCQSGYDGYYCTRADALTAWANGGDLASYMPYRIEDWGAFNVAISGCDAHFDEELHYRPAQPGDSADTAAP